VVERTDALRRDIEDRRRRIGHTVDQIENRVHPGRAAARWRYRTGVRLRDWRDHIMGSHEDGSGPGAGDPGLGERVGTRVSEVGDRIAETPDMMRRQTRGNPLAAGLVALGAGLLAGSLLPQTRTEQRAAQRIQPGLEGAVSEASDAGRQMVDDMRESAQEATEHVKEEATRATSEVRERVASTSGETHDRPPAPM
jgi:hypothetical protein